MKISYKIGKLRALASVCLSLACSAAAKLSALDFTTLKTDTGFACVVCNAIYEDSYGFVWLGGQGILMRCEGRRVKAYLRDPQDSRSFPGGQIFALAEDSKRRLLVSTDQGLVRFDPRTDRFEDLGLAEEDGAKPRVYSAIEDRRGAVWASTDRAIYRRGPDEASFRPVRRHAKPPTIVFSPNCPLVQDSKGSIYAGTPDGLFVAAGGGREWSGIALDSSAGGGEGAEVVSLALDARGRLWIATWGGGLQLLAPGENAPKAIRFGQFPKSADVNARITTLSVAASGAVLICCASEGVYRYEPETGKIVLFKASMAEKGAIPDTSVFVAYEDARGLLWAGGNAAAYLAPLAPSPFKFALAGNSILDIVEEKAGTFLLATAGSVLRWNRATGALRDLAAEGTIPRSTGGAVYTEIIYGRDGALWIGSWGGGVLRLEPATGRLRGYAVDELGKGALPNESVLELFQDSKGGLWVGTMGGLALYDPKRDGFYAPLLEGEDAARLASAEVWRFIEEADGRFMIATSVGLLRYDPSTGRAERWANDPDAPESLIEDHLIELQENGDGRYWVGTWYSGLDLFDPRTGVAEHITTRDGMPDNIVVAVIPDGPGRCWVSTSYGLARVEGGGAEVRAFFKERDGLPTTGFNGTSSCCRASDGTMLFGADGVVWFSPQEVADDPIAAPARILAVRSLDGKIALPSAYVFESADIPWRSNALSIEFGALDFATGAGTQYQYRLRGHDDQWISAGYSKIAHYSDLPGGSFVFEVRATDSEGAWSPEATWASLRLDVGTHPAKSWWAISIYVLASALAVFGAFASLRRRQALRLAAAKAEAARERDHAERLTRLDQLKDAFLANTSHELRTPLHGIVGIAESLLEGAAGAVGDVMSRNLSMIVSSGKRLASLVDDILDFSKLKERDLELRIKAVDLRRSVEVVMSLTEPLVRGKALELANEVPEGLPPLRADPNRLQQILHNLLGNAVKFTESGRIVVGARASDHTVSFFVSDTGRGIPAESIPELFKSFEQLDASIEREYGGTGLGLAITKKLAELMGGAIIAESEPGRGSTFTVTLPVAEAGLEAPAEQDIARLAARARGAEPPEIPSWASAPEGLAPSPGTGMTILVVDDEPVNLQVLANLLSLRSYQVVQARSGREALDVVREKLPDLILLDIMMPKMNGYEVCERLRQEYPAAETPIIMLTAKNQVGDLVKGLGLGANDYLTKPFSSEELAARIKTHLQLSKINIAYGRFVPREFLDILERESIIDVKLGDQVQRDMSVMFCDIQGFTTLSERLSPAETFRVVNDYLGAAVPLIRREGGIIDKYIGDSIMALFPAEPDAALRAAAAVQEEVARRGAMPGGGLPQGLRVGIGIHTGSLILGTIGETTRMQETVISDAVNLASRVEGLTRILGVDVLISEATSRRLARPKDFTLRFLGKVAVKGRKEGTSVFELVLGEEQPSRKRNRADFEAGLEAYFTRRFGEAVGRFSKIVQDDPRDKAAALYLQRSAIFMGSPPGKEWDGVERLTEK